MERRISKAACKSSSRLCPLRQSVKFSENIMMYEGSSQNAGDSFIAGRQRISHMSGKNSFMLCFGKNAIKYRNRY